MSERMRQLPASKECPHPSFAIVAELDDELGEMFKLYCAHCKKELPFFFYSVEEWEEV